MCAGHSPLERVCGWCPGGQSLCQILSGTLSLSCGSYSQKGGRVCFLAAGPEGPRYVSSCGMKQARRGARWETERLLRDDGAPAGRWGTRWEMMGRPLGDGVPSAPPLALPTGCTLCDVTCHLLRRLTRYSVAGTALSPTSVTGMIPAVLPSLRRGFHIGAAR